MLKTSAGWEHYNVFSGDVPSVGWIDVLVSDVVFTDSTLTGLPADDFMVVPNPVEKDADILYPEDGAAVLTIYNNQCRLPNIGGQLAPGTYLIQLEMEGEKVVRKMMVK
jgi:lysyl endopeptidase